VGNTDKHENTKFVLFQYNSSLKFHRNQENNKMAQVHNYSQNAQLEAIRLATTYANFAQNQPLYEHKAIGTPLSAYSVALADYFGKPEVLSIDISNWTGEIGQTIRIKARDNIMVLKVCVMIRENNASETALEAGEAVQSETDRFLWTYTTTALVPQTPGTRLDVFAYDLPGNMGGDFLELD
jgi:hypothetical protein